MRFNDYVWELYKISPRGIEQIEFWQPLTVFADNKFAIKLSKAEDFEILRRSGLEKYIIADRVNYRQLRFDFLNSKYNFEKANIRELFIKWIKEGLKIEDFVIFPENEPAFWFNMIRPLSKLFYDLHPDYFFPYTLECKFNLFSSILKEFNIPLPALPKKSDFENRTLYYLDLCDALLEFRRNHHFSAAELCAFLYDFAPTVILQLMDEEMPAPSKAWFVGGNRQNYHLLEDAQVDDIISWQGNVDTRRGDIIVMYCLSPRSCIHSIWRANCDGFADPFFHWYNVIEITNPIKLDVTVSQNELENNSIWSKNPLVRKNLQGINGYPIKYHEYLELLSMLEGTGQNINKLPMILQTTHFDSTDLQNERDVEIHLIEPMINLLGYSDKDWIRQMSVKMGRGERNFPDYCFGVVTKRGEEKATILLESKYEIRTRKELYDAYLQTKSYSLRLQSERFVIASKEGIWVFSPKDQAFSFENHFHCSWIEAEGPDTLHTLRKLIGKH